MPIPRIEFSRKVESTQYGLRVRWAMRRHAIFHPQLWEVVAAADGVRVCGYSPALDTAAAKTLATILGHADAISEAIRDGISRESLCVVLATIDSDHSPAPTPEPSQEREPCCTH